MFIYGLDLNIVDQNSRYAPISVSDVQSSLRDHGQTGVRHKLVCLTKVKRARTEIESDPGLVRLGAVVTRLDSQMDSNFKDGQRQRNKPAWSATLSGIPV